MITIRPIQFPEDYETLIRWWAKRGVHLMPKDIFPATGAVAESDGVTVAMSFLYVDVGGAMAMIEWTSTNPEVGPCKALLQSVKSLYEHLEREAEERGCIMILSMVAPNTGEQRIMGRMGYLSQTPDEPSHIMFAKYLKGAVPCQL